MKLLNRILLGTGCIALVLVSWYIAMHSKSTEQLQLDLMAEAAALTEDGIYTLAAPLLEEAAGYSTIYTLAAESELKKVYLSLIDKRGYMRKYTDLLSKQMSRKDAKPEIYAEAALHYLGIANMTEALNTLKEGISKTGSEDLIALYESSRYAFETGRDVYDDVMEILDSYAQVCIDGLWGFARSDGVLMIPCEYECVSTFCGDRAIVKIGDEIIAIDKDNNRVAKLHQSATAFGNYSTDRIPLLFDDGWHRATGEFTVGNSAFEYIGMYSGGYAAAKIDGKWGVIGMSQEWLIPAKYDGIIQDELGRCYGQGAVFVQEGDHVCLFVNGRPKEEVYENAHPFMREGYAAVMQDGRWGFIDTNGTKVIECLYDDALSFGGHLAAVRVDGLWGYISTYAVIVIDPVYVEAKSFSNGSAPVLTGRGWQFITLIEYKAQDAGLLS